MDSGSRTILRVCACLLSMGLSLSQAHAEGDATKANAEFLARLQARDREFDNVHLQYFMRGTLTIEDHSWKRRSRSRQDPARPAYQPPRTVKYLHRDSFTVFGDELTHSREVIEPPANDPSAQMMRVSKSRVAGGLRTEVTLASPDSKQGLAIQERIERPRHAAESHWLREVKFALGFGFGECMTSIESVENVADGFKVTGQITLGSDRTWPCALELDRGLIVRHAVIDAEYPRLEVTTKGTQPRGGFLFAESGSIARFADDKLKDRYFILFEDAEFQLDDQRRRELTTIEVPSGMVVGTGIDLENLLKPAGVVGTEAVEVLPR